MKTSDITTAFSRMVAPARQFPPAEFRLSESGIDPRYRLAKALGLLEDSFSEENLYQFWTGNVVEKALLREIGRDVLLTRQAKVKTPWGDVGHVDARIRGTKEILEIKTTSPTQWDNLPHNYNIYQVQAYLWYGKFEKCHLVYIDRSGRNGIKVFPVLPNLLLQEEINRVLAFLHSKNVFPTPEEWKDAENRVGFRLKDYYTPRSFVDWCSSQDNYSDLFSIEEQSAEFEEARQIAEEFAEAKDNGDTATEKYCTEKLEEYFERGYTEIPILGDDGIRTLKAAKVESESLNIKKARKCGIPIPEELNQFVNRKVYWRKYINGNKNNGNESEREEI